jgi:hypothetical protein
MAEGKTPELLTKGLPRVSPKRLRAELAQSDPTSVELEYSPMLEQKRHAIAIQRYRQGEEDPDYIVKETEKDYAVLRKPTAGKIMDVEPSRGAVYNAREFRRHYKGLVGDRQEEKGHREDRSTAVMEKHEYRDFTPKPSRSDYKGGLDFSVDLDSPDIQREKHFNHKVIEVPDFGKPIVKVNGKRLDAPVVDDVENQALYRRRIAKALGPTAVYPGPKDEWPKPLLSEDDDDFEEEEEEAEEDKRED